MSMADIRALKARKTTMRCPMQDISKVVMVALVFFSGQRLRADSLSARILASGVPA
jgi:hypothetical protein